jgi:hypothetical protein
MTRCVARALMVVMLQAAAAFADDATQKFGDVPVGMQGLWAGSWGGGQRDGVVFQPVLAEMVIHGEQIEISGFRLATRVSGTVAVDVGHRKIRVAPQPSKEQPAPMPILFTYEQRQDRLTLTDHDGIAVVLQQQRAEKAPLANVRLEFVAADGINNAGDLLVTEFHRLVPTGTTATYYQPVQRTLKTQGGKILLQQADGAKEVSVDQARQLIQQPTPVVIASTGDNPAPFQNHELWKDLGPALPASEAVLRTLAKVLRPGTLIVVLPAPETVPVP